MSMLGIIGVGLFMLIVGLVIHLLFSNVPSVISVNKEISKELFETPSRLKFKSTWFSDDYVTPYFYHYGWQPLKTVGKPIWGLEDNWVENISYRLGNGNFEYEKRRWATVGDCLKHNQNVYAECKKNNESLEKQRREIYENKKAALKKANS